MRGFFCKPRKPFSLPINKKSFSPTLKGEIFLGIFGWKLLTIKSTRFVLFLFFMGCVFLAWAHGLQIREIGWCVYSQLRQSLELFLTFSTSAKFGTFQLRQSLKLCRSFLCRSFLCRSSLCWSSLCWSSLCWSSLCRSSLCRNSLCRSSLSRSSLSRSSLSRSSLCWSYLSFKLRWSKYHLFSSSVHLFW